MNSTTYLTIAYKQNYVLQKLIAAKIDGRTTIAKNEALIGLW